MRSTIIEKTLTMEEIATRAPSIFASAPMDDVSDKYKFVSTVEVLDSLRKEGWEPYQVSEQRVNKDEREGFQKHMIRLKNVKQDMRIELGNGDTTFVTAILMNSHDRSCAYRLAMGAFRLICSNGLIVFDSNFGNFRIKHINFDDGQVLEASEKIIKNVPQVYESINAMSNVRLSPFQAMEFAERAIRLRWTEEQLKNISVNPEDVIKPKRFDGGGKDNLWSVFNNAQENFMKGGVLYSRLGVSGPGRYRRSRVVTGIDQDIKLNSNLWSLAMEYVN